VHYYQNPNLASQERRLFLNGVNLELISISIDGVQPNYQLVDEGLEISDLADEFTLEITTRIHPEKNTSLNGLYQSSGNFCTQCEAHGFRQITYYLDRPDVLSVFTTHIKADHKRYPILLSNGNLISSKPGEVTWHDPSLKPCYLFALVAGGFSVLEDTYTTISGKEGALKIYVESIKNNTITFGIGPAGTGKTYLAIAMALSYFTFNKVGKVILTRPAVEAGERLGFLPGNITEKVNPYLRPLYDALNDILGVENVLRLIEKGFVEIAPLAFMRGRTLNDSFIILDEAQNTTSEQMKMFLTRLGFNSKAVITGDITQIDLPNNIRSGLVEAEKLLKDIKGIAVVKFSKSDVVRHKIVKDIIKAYESK
jgi:hypothetical protein